MVSGEVMRWVVWDASTSTVYGATVEYDSTPPFHPNGQYGANRFYALTLLEPMGEPLSGAEVFIPLVIVQ
jgi:GDP-D-mannose dehydratase